MALNGEKILDKICKKCKYQIVNFIIHPQNYFFMQTVSVILWLVVMFFTIVVAFLVSQLCAQREKIDAQKKQIVILCSKKADELKDVTEVNKIQQTIAEILNCPVVQYSDGRRLLPIVTNIRYSPEEEDVSPLVLHAKRQALWVIKKESAKNENGESVIYQKEEWHNVDEEGFIIPNEKGTAMYDEYFALLKKENEKSE